MLFAADLCQNNIMSVHISFVVWSCQRFKRGHQVHRVGFLISLKIKVNHTVNGYHYGIAQSSQSCRYFVAKMLLNLIVVYCEFVYCIEFVTFITVLIRFCYFFYLVSAVLVCLCLLAA